MVKERNVRVERLRWQLLAAVSGIGVAAVTCGGQSSSDEKQEPDATGGASGAGERGGASGAGGSGGTSGESGTSAGGSAGAGGESGGGNPTGGLGPTGGTGGTGGRGELGECENPRDVLGLVQCEDGYVHRPAAARCPYPPRDGVGGGGDGGGAGAAAREFGECATDADCGTNGYCVYNLQDTYVCVTAACESDSDCAEGHVCACEEFDDVALGQCRAASCATDSDCGGAALCISPLDIGSCFGSETTVFHCQSSTDECFGPDTCEGNPGRCSRDSATSTFVCDPNSEACGRPFLVDGVARRASVVHASDGSWSEDFGCSESALLELSEAERLELARHFTNAGLMEHASIAAFARFSLQLLALGAPPSLVEEAVRAMADETRHARICFGLARRFGDAPVGPGPLALDGALPRTELLDVVKLVIAEGCIGETVAALEASFAAGEAVDPALRHALETIAEDETRHAALAFRFVAWAAERDPRVARLFEHSVAEARDLSTQPPRGAPNERSRRLARYGLLDAASRGEARRRALNEVVPSLFVLAEPVRRLEQRVPAHVVA